MKLYRTVAAAAAAFIASVSANAQETAPDGTAAFGIEPYVGIMGGYESHDRSSEFNGGPGHVKLNGGIVEGVAGVNVPLSAFLDRKSTRLNSSHIQKSRMPSSA